MPFAQRVEIGVLAVIRLVGLEVGEAQALQHVRVAVNLNVENVPYSFPKGRVFRQGAVKCDGCISPRQLQAASPDRLRIRRFVPIVHHHFIHGGGDALLHRQGKIHADELFILHEGRVQRLFGMKPEAGE